LEIESEVLPWDFIRAIAINSCSRDKKDSHPRPESIFKKRVNEGQKGMKNPPGKEKNESGKETWLGSLERISQPIKLESFGKFSLIDKLKSKLSSNRDLNTD
jgi:hypothetical protein